MIKFYLSLFVSCLFLVSCSSSKDLEQLRSQVFSLQNDVKQLEQNISTLSMEVDEFKGQRPVRLPAGSPTVVIERSVGLDKQAYEGALAVYKSGDLEGGVHAFHDFIGRYPESVYNQQAKFYLAQANYTLRNFTEAQTLLEALFYNTNNPNRQVVELLMSTYQAEGLDDKAKELESYLQ